MNHLDGCCCCEVWLCARRGGAPGGEVPAGKPAPGDEPGGGGALTAEDWVALRRTTHCLP